MNTNSVKFILLGHPPIIFEKCFQHCFLSHFTCVSFELRFILFKLKKNGIKKNIHVNSFFRLVSGRRVSSWPFYVKQIRTFYFFCVCCFMNASGINTLSPVQRMQPFPLSLSTQSTRSTLYSVSMTSDLNRCCKKSRQNSSSQFWIIIYVKHLRRCRCCRHN